MTIAQDNVFSILAAPSITKSPITPYQQYERILVILDGTAKAEQAIAGAVVMARSTDAEIILICRQHLGAKAYVYARCADLWAQGLTVRAHIVDRDLTDLPVKLKKSKASSVIIIAQKRQGWIQRLFGANRMEQLQDMLNADVITVNH